MAFEQPLSSLSLKSTVVFSHTETTVLSSAVLTTTPPVDGSQPDDKNDPDLIFLYAAIPIVCAILILLVATVLFRSAKMRTRYTRFEGKSLSHDGHSTGTRATFVTDKEPNVFHMVTAYPANINFTGDPFHSYMPSDDYWSRKVTST
ncbi:uncharacterized protein LOC134681864 [Mytilus trossulus]|uniref:uncharacterized protein LOC134681864 n=1 Tax=Mytilus trossulus TaxID=6551 RepID=UPI0030041BB8